MKLLPHVFKWIGLTVFLIGFTVSIIDDGRHGYIDGWNEAMSSGDSEIAFVRIMPIFVSTLADYATLLGLLLYILSKNRREDEFAQKLRYESAFIVLVVSILLVFILYVVDSEIKLSPSTVLMLQMVFYLIVRVIKKFLILE